MPSARRVLRWWKRTQMYANVEIQEVSDAANEVEEANAQMNQERALRNVASGPFTYEDVTFSYVSGVKDTILVINEFRFSRNKTTDFIHFLCAIRVICCNELLQW